MLIGLVRCNILLCVAIFRWSAVCMVIWIVLRIFDWIGA